MLIADSTQVETGASLDASKQELDEIVRSAFSGERRFS
jgi:hypothetical protein